MKNFTKTNNEEFEKYGFLVVRDFYDISSFIQEPPKSERGQLLHRPSGFTERSNDDQVPDSYSIYNDPQKRFDHSQIRLKLEKILGKKLENTYYYERFYFDNQMLRKHVDRDACEISISIHIGTNIKTPWPFKIEDPEGKEHSLILNVGDGVVYKGRERIHWRDLIPEDTNDLNYYHQIFFHYVLSDGYFVFNPFDNK